ncbi:MAG TPA: hypothetical protein VIY50_11470 [Steroidobacteraceae bacterium]
MKTVVAAGITAALGLTAAQACGPDFQIALTTCGSVCLREIRTEGLASTFSPALAKVASPITENEISSVRVQDLEGRDLTEQQRKELTRMRSASTGDEAYAIGADLPAAARLYTAGAVDFLRAHQLIPYLEDDAEPVRPQPGLGNAASQAVLTAAITRFQAVTALSAREGASRRLWAEYMLGRAYRLRGAPGDLDRARSHFERVTALVIRGADDPMGLGNAALGELGGIALQRDQLQEALMRYAQQADSPGANYSLSSLKWTLDRLTRSPTGPSSAVQSLMAKPLPQRLLIAYALDGIGMTCDMEECSTIWPDFGPGSRSRYILTALEAVPPGQLVATDQAAALAYYYGDYAFAERVVGRADSPLADWIRGKLALHRGDLREAEADFARAAPHFPPTRDESDSNIGQRFHAEWGVLRLQRHDYAGALDLFLHDAPAFQADIGYIAERVLTIAELQHYIDDHPNCGDLVREILATRLARSNRRSEAVTYYPGHKDAAEAYAKGWELARHAKTAIERAQAWYALAQLDIADGMRLEGSQLAPDGALEGGSFVAYNDMPSDIASADERARFRASRIEPDRRYHYRAVAVAHLLRAVSELPRHSAIASAVLCQGANLLRHHGEKADGDLIEQLYRRYQEVGLPQAWDRNFGAKCPAPRFDATLARAPS